MMEKVTVSPKFQVVIPRAARTRLDIRPGQQLQVIAYEDRLEPIPLKAPRELRGLLPGPNSFKREPDRL